MHDEVRSSSAVPHEAPTWIEEPSDRGRRSNSRDTLAVDLTAAVIAFHEDQPVVLTRPELRGAAGAAVSLPSGDYRPSLHQSLDTALRERVSTVTGLDLGYVEQLSTHCDPAAAHQSSRTHLAIGYLALMRVEGPAASSPSAWISCYDFFPWEDWRKGRPAVLADQIMPRLLTWAGEASAASAIAHPLNRYERLRMMFGLDGGKWDDERVLERLEILEQSGLVGIAAEFTMRPDHHEYSPRPWRGCAPRSATGHWSSNCCRRFSRCSSCRRRWRRFSVRTSINKTSDDWWRVQASSNRRGMCEPTLVDVRRNYFASVGKCCSNVRRLECASRPVARPDHPGGLRGSAAGWRLCRHLDRRSGARRLAGECRHQASLGRAAEPGAGNRRHLVH